MTEHAKLSPSSADRWMNCTASVRLVETMPEQPSSIFAVEGTAIHWLAELKLTQEAKYLEVKNAKNPVFQDKREPDLTVELTDEHFAAAEAYCDYIESIKKESTNPAVYVERRVQITPPTFITSIYGTADCLVVDEGTATLHVVDLKGGKGVKVSAFQNAQLSNYAVGAYHLLSSVYDIDNVRLHVVQPRLDTFSTYDMTLEELDQFETRLLKRAKEAHSNKAVFAPSEKACRWCPASGNCEAQTAYVMRLAVQDFVYDPIGLAQCGRYDSLNVGTLNDDQLTAIYEQLPLIKNFLNDIKKETERRLLDGKQLDGLKLVHGRSTRRWNPEACIESIADKLRQAGLSDEQIYTTALITPAKAEKLIGKKDNTLDGLIAKTEGAMTIAATDDPRPAFSTTADALVGFG